MNTWLFKTHQNNLEHESLFIVARHQISNQYFLKFWQHTRHIYKLCYLAAGSFFAQAFLDMPEKN